jgi:hypothetical protein
MCARATSPPARCPAAFTFVAGSEGVWLGTNTGFLQVDPSGTHLTGLKVTGSPRYFNPESPDYIGSPNATQLALGDGAVWVLFGNVSGRPEHLAGYRGDEPPLYHPGVRDDGGPSPLSHGPPARSAPPSAPAATAV